MSLSLSDVIRQRFEHFSRSQKDIGQYIVDHIDDASFYTAEELARRASTSSSTVVRFAQALGFDGFPELQTAAREEYRRLRDELSDACEPAINGGAFGIDQTPFEAALYADFTNVEETARRLDRREVQSVISAIASASSVVVCGAEQMAFFASYLRHLLLLLNLSCEAVTGASQSSISRLTRIDENTCVVGLSAGRPQRLVVQALKLARQRGAATVAICDATLSEVGQLAEIRLFYSAASPGYVRSNSALLALLQALSYGVFALDEDAYSERLKTLRLK